MLPSRLTTGSENINPRGDLPLYHRVTTIWGPDAREFRPSRWFEDEPCKGQALGPHASLYVYPMASHRSFNDFLLNSLAFGGGPAVCLGYALFKITDYFANNLIHLAGGLRMFCLAWKVAILTAYTASARFKSSLPRWYRSSI